MPNQQQHLQALSLLDPVISPIQEETREPRVRGTATNSYRQYMALQTGKPYAFSEKEIAMCREKLWTESLFKRTWDHFRAKLG